MNEKEMKALGYQIIDYIVDHRLNLKQRNVYDMTSVNQLPDILDKEAPEYGRPAEEVFAQLHQLVGTNMVHTDHPRFYSFIPGPSSYTSVLADTLSVGMNVFAGHWMASPAAGWIEKKTIQWLTQFFGYGAKAGGIFLSGGSMANMSAIVAARDKAFGDNEANNGTIYYSDQTHSSIAKAARVLGFKPKNMRPIKTTEDFKLSIDDLTSAIEEDIKAGLQPFCVVGNAGTTNTGAIDDLKSLALLTDKYRIWLHIDAAYGGATIMSDKYKHLLDHINLADSISIDPHKWWFQPYETACLLVQDSLDLKRSFAVEAEYLEDTVRDDDEVNYYDYGPQLTRSFRAFKLYSYIQCQGTRNIGKDITLGIEHAEYIQHRMSQSDYWEIVSSASIGIISFRANPKGYNGDLDELNSELSQFTYDDGYTMITTTKLNGHVALRMCPINPHTTREDLDTSIDKMENFLAVHI